LKWKVWKWYAGTNPIKLNRSSTCLGIIMALSKGEFASADGPYVRHDDTEVKEVKYLEIVKVLKEADLNGDVYVEGLDSHARFRIQESSLTFFANSEWKPS
jgi:hypothetical protein